MEVEEHALERTITHWNSIDNGSFGVVVDIMNTILMKSMHYRQLPLNYHSEQNLRVI
ncbi:hypothetical protein BWQ96_04286 [Gracilariopsis chorda]|uniref:Uncharacterized protein n=1 Tax=Gracilariopsis chorda TaxID=448386 RepID=A0A2V3IV55_9FLOR|nr:hypothetical protein BWQ96_04286 [Gracilariopsis chorda]|eukprot:PXF45973.1 hypothetical protein BWQ96_04286 [Gracilariopsis chorda]